MAWKAIAFLSVTLLPLGRAQSIATEFKVDENYMGIVVVTNLGSLAVTAYAFRTESRACAGDRGSGVDYHGMDVATNVRLELLKPGESRIEGIGGMICAPRPNVPSEGGPLGAVFEDSSTFGDSIAVAGILRNRQYELAAIGDVIARLEAARDARESKEQVEADIRAAQSHFENSHRQTQAERLPRFEPYGTAIVNLSAGSRSTEAAIAGILDRLNTQKAKLVAARPPVEALP